MEKRNIQINLNTAKEWYKKGNELKEVALQAFSEEELTKIELPKTWEEFCKNYPKHPEETFIDINSQIDTIQSTCSRLIECDKNILPSKEAAEAHRALMQLHQLRDVYRQGWVPNYNEVLTIKYAIKFVNNALFIIEPNTVSNFLTFQSKEIAKQFLENFEDLILKVKNLI